MASPGNAGRVFITGIDGFTGRHLAARLAADGWDVLGLRYPAQRQDASGYACLNAPLGARDELVPWLREQRPTHIVHLAASSHVVGDALGFYATNLIGTESLLESIVAAGLHPQKVLIASSANIYGNAAVSPISESAPMQPMNHYALSKCAMELLLAKWFGRLPILITRPFNYTGPGQSESFVIPKIVKAFHQRAETLRLGNLDVSRDISDIRFVVEAYRRLLSSPAHSMAVNLCSGRSVALLEIVSLMRGIAGHSPELVTDPAFQRTDEIKDLCGDPGRLFGLVGPLSVVPIADTLQTMYSALPADGHAVQANGLGGS